MSRVKRSPERIPHSFRREMSRHFGAFIRLILVAASGICTAAAAESGRDIVAKAVEAERENRLHMVNYIFVEDITRSAFDRTRQLISRTAMSYEVLFIEGKPAFKKTSIDGRPLTPEESAAEMARLRRVAQDRKANPQKASLAEEKRRSYPFHRFLDLHEFRLTGEESLNGRRCWVIDSKPRHSAHGESRDDKRIVESTARFWIDQETFHRVRMQVTGLKPLGPAHVKESTQYEWGQPDGTVWLITSIRTVLPLGGKNNEVAWFEGEQRYSRYRRFISESKVSDIHQLESRQ